MHRYAGLLGLGLLFLLPNNAFAHGCTGDCNGNDVVTASELMSGVRIAVGLAPILTCPAFDVDRDFRVGDDELYVAVNNVFNYCGHGEPPTPTPVPTATGTPAPSETPGTASSPAASLRPSF